MERERLHQQMTQGRIAPLILRLSIPNALALISVMVYSIVDSYFVSSLGTEASAAVGVSFALHILIQAVGYTFGMGGGSLLSRLLGKKEAENATAIAITATILSVLCGIIIAAGGLFFREPLARLLGANVGTLTYAVEYLTPLLFSAPIVCAVFVLSQLLRAEGLATYSMIGLVVGSICNIALNPLLIFQFGMGIAGSSIATGISQTISLIILLSAYFFKKSRLPKIRYSIRQLASGGRIFIAGLPSLFRQGLSGVAAIFLNRAAAIEGDSAVAAISLVARVFLLVFSVCLGIGQGMMPVVGYNHGANYPQRMKKAFLFAVFISSVAMLTISIPLFAWAPKIFSRLQDSAEVTEIGTSALRAQSLVLATHGLVSCTILYLQAIGKNILGTILASARQGFFFLPLILILPQKFGLWGLEWAQPFADIITFIFALPFFLFVMKKLQKAIKHPVDISLPH